MDILIVFCKTLILFEVSRRGFSSETTTLPVFQRHLCLQDAIHIHVELSHERCPYSLIEKDKTNCSITCIGKLETANSDNCQNHGVDFMLLDQSNEIPIIHEEFLNFSKCILTTMTIKCDFQFPKENKNESGFATVQKGRAQHGSPIGLVGVVIGCSLGVVLTLFGTLLMKSPRDKCRRRHLFPENLDPYPPSQSVDNHGVCTEIEEMRMLVKATQVPSLNDKSPLSERSWTSNTYHTLAEMGSLGKSTTLTHETSSDKLRTSNHSSNGSRQSQLSEFSVKEDVQQRESGDCKTYFQLEQQTLAIEHIF